MNQLDVNRIEDDDDIKLSDFALKALKEFYDEQTNLKSEPTINKSKLVGENWNLSQFWYDKETTEQLTKEVLKLAETFLENNNTNTKFSIACVSCPTLFNNLYSILNNEDNKFYKKIDFKLFEYDKRFDEIYNQNSKTTTTTTIEENFIFYDYNKPLDIDKKYKNIFHLVIADPPYISEECMIKTSMTIRYLLFNNNNNNNNNDYVGKIIVCTGQVVKELLEKCLNLKQCLNFEPKHERNLANEFKCYTNYNTYYLN